MIPLKECNCQLAVYAEPRDNSQPVLKPTLEVVKAAVPGIPGAGIAFKAGAYELELRGTPKPGANFQPLNYSFQSQSQELLPPRLAFLSPPGKRCHKPQQQAVPYPRFLFQQ